MLRGVTLRDNASRVELWGCRAARNAALLSPAVTPAAEHLGVGALPRRRSRGGVEVAEVVLRRREQLKVGVPSDVGRVGVGDPAVCGGGRVGRPVRTTGAKRRWVLASAGETYL